MGNRNSSIFPENLWIWSLLLCKLSQRVDTSSLCQQEWPTVFINFRTILPPYPSAGTVSIFHRLRQAYAFYYAQFHQSLQSCPTHAPVRTQHQGSPHPSPPQRSPGIHIHQSRCYPACSSSSPSSALAPPRSKSFPIANFHELQSTGVWNSIIPSSETRSISFNGSVGYLLQSKWTPRVFLSHHRAQYIIPCVSFSSQSNP